MVTTINCTGNNSQSDADDSNTTSASDCIIAFDVENTVLNLANGSNIIDKNVAKALDADTTDSAVEEENVATQSTHIESTKHILSSSLNSYWAPDSIANKATVFGLQENTHALITYDDEKESNMLGFRSLAENTLYPNQSLTSQSFLIG